MADRNRVPAGQALAVDRDGFSEEITKILKNVGKYRNNRRRVYRKFLRIKL